PASSTPTTTRLPCHPCRAASGMGRASPARSARAHAPVPRSAEPRDDLLREQLDRPHHLLVRDAIRLHERDEVVEPGLLVALDLPDAVVDVPDDHHVLLVEVLEGALVALHLHDDRILLGDEVAVGGALDLEIGVLALHATPARVGEAAEDAEGVEEV